MMDVYKILNMSQDDLIKHQFLKYRVKRLEEVYDWIKEHCIRFHQQAQRQAMQQQQEN